MKVRESKKGFTIIEVVVVLAIAGLIFGVVFWALPNLQRSNRDSTRRTIASNIIANLDQYSANKNGTYPVAATTGTGGTGFGEFLTAFFKDGVSDPLAGDFQDATNTNTAILYGVGRVDNAATQGALRYTINGTCGGTYSGQIIAGSGQRAVAVAIKLEQGGGYCVDNN